MKRYRKILIILGSFLQLTFLASAQGSNASPVNEWIEKGYWVVEGNIHSPMNNIIYIYDNNDSLIYKERIDGLRINIRKEATRKKLDKVVEIIMFGFRDSKQDENTHWILNNILKRPD